jgi:hypothetical protein
VLSMTSQQWDEADGNIPSAFYMIRAVDGFHSRIRCKLDSTGLLLTDLSDLVLVECKS